MQGENKNDWEKNKGDFRVKNKDVNYDKYNTSKEKSFYIGSIPLNSNDSVGRKLNLKRFKKKCSGTREEEAKDNDSKAEKY